MIDLEHNRIRRGDLDEPIRKWEVWYKTPFGLCNELSEALEQLKSTDMDANLCMKPIPVALSQSTYESYDP